MLNKMYIPKFMFNDIFSKDWSNEFDYENSVVTKKEEGYTMKLAVPGLTKQDLKVEIDPSELRMVIQYNGEATEFVNKFKRAYMLPTDVEIESIVADVVNGVLVIEMPKTKKTNKLSLL